MNVYENEDLRGRITRAFPKMFVNRQFEAIIYPKRNSYFLLSGVETEEQLIAKVLEWLSREACKSISPASQRYHLDGINAFLGTSFTQEDVRKIYQHLGNCINHDLTLRFIQSGYDLNILDG